MAGASVGGLIFSPACWGSGSAFENQKDLGVAFVDIGFGTTSMCVYEEGKLLHLAVFPVGSGNITNDLAIGLKTSVDTAEAVNLRSDRRPQRNFRQEQVDLKKLIRFFGTMFQEG